MIAVEKWVCCDCCGAASPRVTGEPVRRVAIADGFVRRSTIWADERWDLCPDCEQVERAGAELAAAADRADGLPPDPALHRGVRRVVSVGVNPAEKENQ